MPDIRYTIFPSTTYLHTPDVGIFSLAAAFPTKEYATIGDASQYYDLIPPSPDDTLVISCSPADFVRRVSVTAGGVVWFNAFMNVDYAITNANEICRDGVKAMLGQAVTRTVPTTMFVLLLCPVILTQTDGQPKMFRNLEGFDLVTNNRPDVWDTLSDPVPLTPENTINMMVWAGQHIDQLRDRVLSVIVGRILLLVSVNQMYGLTGIEGQTKSLLNVSLRRDPRN